MPNVFSVNLLVHSFCKVGDLGSALGYLRNSVFDHVLIILLLGGSVSVDWLIRVLGCCLRWLRRMFVLIRLLVIYLLRGIAELDWFNMLSGLWGTWLVGVFH